MSRSTHAVLWGGLALLLASLTLAISVGAVPVPLGTVSGVFLNKL